MKEPQNARVIGLVLAITEMYLISLLSFLYLWAFTSSPFSSLIPSLKLPISYFAWKLVWHWKGGGIGWRSRWWVEGTGSTARSFAMPFMMTGSMMLLIVQRREQLPRMLITQLLPIWYFSSSLISNRVSQQKLLTAFWLLKGPFLRNSLKPIQIVETARMERVEDSKNQSNCPIDMWQIESQYWVLEKYKPWKKHQFNNCSGKTILNSFSNELRSLWHIWNQSNATNLDRWTIMSPAKAWHLHGLSMLQALNLPYHVRRPPPKLMPNASWNT